MRKSCAPLEVQTLAIVLSTGMMSVGEREAGRMGLEAIINKEVSLVERGNVSGLFTCLGCGRAAGLGASMLLADCS